MGLRIFYLFLSFFFIIAAKVFGQDSSPTMSPIAGTINVISGTYFENSQDLEFFGSHPLSINRFFFGIDGGKSSDGLAWHFNHPNIITNFLTHMPAIPAVDTAYDYEYDLFSRLKQITICNSDRSKIFHQCELEYTEEDDKKFCFIKSSDGRKISYLYHTTDKSRSTPEVVIDAYFDPQGAEKHYQYINHPFERKQLLKKIIDPEGGYIENEYYSAKYNNVGGELVTIEDFLRNPMIGKIKLQKAPLGPCNTPVITQRYFYSKNHTDVVFANGLRNRYYHIRDKIVKVETYLHNAESPYKIQNIYWKDIDTTSKIVCMTLEDGSGEIYVCQNYFYDAGGHLIESRVTGNLSGLSTAKIALDPAHIPLENGVEHASTFFEYFPETSLVSKKIEPSGKITRLIYQPDTKLNSAIFIQKGDQIVIRKFFVYDLQGRILKIISDDGSSENIDDLNDISERFFENFYYNEIDLPESIEEKYLDPLTSSEKLIRRISNQYNLMHLLEKQSIYDSEENLIKNCYFKYDPLGRCIYSCDTSDEKFIKYDLCGRVKEETHSSHGVTTKKIVNCYDLAGRLVRTVSKVDDVETSQTFQYDSMNNCRVSIDQYGFETHYGFDDLGRVISIISPKTSEDNENPPTLLQVYDIANNITESTDPKGYKTYTTYNILGKPTLIQHPDSTSEQFIYNLDGTLREKIDSHKITTCYTYDLLGRITQEIKYNSDKEIVSCIEHTYNAFHLIESKQNECLIRYFFHQDGKVKEIHKLLGEEFLKVEYDYDSQGRKNREHILSGSDCKSHLLKQLFYDEKGALFKTVMTDLEGNLVREYLDESSKEQLHPYPNFYRELNGKIVHESTDSYGNTTLTTVNFYKKPLHILKKNSIGLITQNINFIYDLNGNCIEENHEKTTSQDKQCYIIKKIYGPKNRLEKVIEGYGLHNQRIYSYSYNSKGIIESIQKPDGIFLYYVYNNNNQISHFFSSDATISYEYSYDDAGNLTFVLDRIHGKTTEKTYNQAHRLLLEKLANRLSIAYEYDSSGRIQSHRFPDGSSVKYSYGHLDMIQIDRFTANNTKSYSYKYLEYDLKGRLLESQMIGDVGNIKATYHDLGHCESIHTPFWQEFFHIDPSRKKINSTIVDGIGEVSTTFELDSNQQLVTENSAEQNFYYYDSLGNRILENNTRYTYGDLNELLSDGIHLYNYDLNGNLIEISSGSITLKFSYDALNRMVSVLTGDDSLTQFIYDSSNRRIEKATFQKNRSDSWIEQEKFSYLYLGNCEIGAVDQTNELIELRILGKNQESEIGSSIALEIKGLVLAPIHDHHGNLRSLINIKTKEVVESYRYTGFGTETIMNGSKEPISAKQSLSPWRFCSKRCDSETGLVFFGKRYYQASTSRWMTLDPLGYVDGVNRYLFTKNNPLANIDCFGMYSISAFFKDCFGFFSNCFEKIFNWGSQTLEFIHRQTESIQQFQPNLTTQFESYFGKGFLMLIGYYTHPLESGVYGQGEVHNKVRITLLNGILNVRSYYSGTLDLINKTHGGANIHYIFRPTGGWCYDFLQGVLIKCGYVSPYAKELASTWKKLIQEMGGLDGGGKIIHYCHSLGGADTYAAASLLTPEELQMINVVTFGSATMIPDTLGFAEAYNYVSIRDGVSLFADPVGYLSGLLKKNENIIFIGSLLGIPFVDHALAVQSYTDTLTTLGFLFMQTYANVM